MILILVVSTNCLDVGRNRADMETEEQAEMRHTFLSLTV